MCVDNNEFRVHVSPEITAVNGRVPLSPTIQYHPNSFGAGLVPREGSMDLIGKEMALGKGSGIVGHSRIEGMPYLESDLLHSQTWCIPLITYQEGFYQAWTDLETLSGTSALRIIPDVGTLLYTGSKRSRTRPPGSRPGTCKLSTSTPKEALLYQQLGEHQTWRDELTTGLHHASGTND